MFKRKKKPAQAAPETRPKHRRKPDADRRETILRIRVSEAERERLEALAGEAGLTLSGLVRDHIGRVRVRNRDDERQRSSLLNRINANLNMIARWVNTHRGAADTIEVIAHLQAIRGAVQVVADQALDQEAELKRLRARVAELEHQEGKR